MNPAERMSCLQCDITTLDVDAIVNAANETLLGGRRCGRRHPSGGRTRAARGMPRARRLPHGRCTHHARLSTARPPRPSIRSDPCTVTGDRANPNCSRAATARAWHWPVTTVAASWPFRRSAAGSMATHSMKPPPLRVRTVDRIPRRPRHPVRCDLRAVRRRGADHLRTPAGQPVMTRSVAAHRAAQSFDF